GRGRDVGSQSRGQHHLREGVGGVAAVEADRAVEPGRAPPRRDAEVAQVARPTRRLDVLHAPGTQEVSRRREGIGRNDERIAAVVQRVVDRQIVARLGHAYRLPVVEPLPGERELRYRLYLERDSSTRTKQLLRFGAWSRETLLQVERILRVRNRVDGAA